MADTIPSNTSSSTTLSANSSSTSTIDYAGDKDWWRVSLQAGYGYEVYLSGSSSGYGTLSDPYLAVYNSAGVVQLSNDDYSLSTRDSYLYLTPSSSGTFFLSAEEYGNNATGTYTISLYRDQLATTASAAAIGINSSTTDLIGYGSDYADWYAVSLTAGVTYQFDLAGAWGDGSNTGLSLWDPWLGLRNSAGALITSDDDSGLGTTNSRIFYTPTSSGTYYLDVRESGSDASGTYRLSVKANPVSAALALGNSQSGNLEFSGDVDLYRISLTAGTTYAFTIDGGTLADPYLELLNGDGATIDFDDDDGSGLNAYLVFTPSSSGTYYLAARESGNNATGSYSVRAWQLPTVSIARSEITEGDSGTTNLVFTLSLSTASPTAVSVMASIYGSSTATAGTDFNATASTITFAPGQTSATFTVQVKGDTVFEPTENVYAFLYSPQGAVLDASSWAALGIIADNDSPYALPSDDGLTYQWYLYPTTGINAFPVWSDYTGAGVRVAVFDQGIDPNHPDLDGNLLTSLGRNASNLSVGGAPVLSSDNHGTAVAGVIGAELDGAGIVGVAYGADLISIYNFNATTNGLNYARNFDVLNNSWGNSGVPDFNWAFGDNFQNPSYFDERDALFNLANEGRSGLGTVVVQSAGNSWGAGDDTNLHNFQNSQYVITVAATNAFGEVTEYSTPGASILVSAPGGEVSQEAQEGGILTTDRISTSGYGTSDYFYIDGTSFSAPIVSGVVALMLEANPDLGYRDVQEILAYSAKVTGESNNTWEYNSATNWNGGGLHYDSIYHDLGFGLVDARAAVRLAESWGSDAHTVANREVVAVSHKVNAQIPDNGYPSGAGDTITVSSNIAVERVEVDLNVTHTFVGDLSIRLISPTGTISWLLWNPAANPENPFDEGTAQDNIHFTFDTVLDWGESSLGTWSISVMDMQGGDIGTFDSWTLNLIGKPASADDCYIYTDEFAEACSDQSGRTSLADTGGIDTLNASACSTASILTLTSNGVCTIDGRSLTISSSTIIENAYGGDGADQISGNSAANSLNGMRGNDTISGLAGNDTLDGGAGNDRLIGNEGTDSLTGGIGDDVFAYQASNESTVSGLDTITDFSSGDRIEFSGISGVSLAQTLYSYQGTINATLSAITANSSINNVAVQFTDGVDGYLYIKGSGTGTSFNGSLIKLAGRTSALGLGDFIGITTTTNFDTSAPTVSSFSPADEATAVAIDSNIVVSFNEAIQRGTGNIVLKTTAGNIIAIYDAAASSNLSISGSTITVNPTNNLSHNTGYRLEFSAGSIKDLAGNSYAGTSSYNFTTQGEMTSGSSGNDNLQASNGNASYDGGAGEDLITFQGMRSQYSISLQANGDVVATNSSGTIVLRDIENIHFSDSAADVSIMNLLPSPRIDTSDAQSYNAKVQTYFIGTLGRAATTSELSQYTSLLASQNGSVWLDTNGQTGTTGSLVAYLTNSSEFASLTAGKSNSQIVDEMYLRLTGDLPSLALHDYYQTKLDASTIRVRGLLNAILNDLSIMPRADGTLNQPSTWTVNIRSDMEPVELVGMVNKLHSIGNISFTNLDASGNLS